MAVLLALVTNRILALFDMPIWLAGASWKIIENKNDDKLHFLHFFYRQIIAIAQVDGSFGNLHFGNILIPAADDFDLEYHKAQENFEYNHRTGQSISLKTK